MVRIFIAYCSGTINYYHFRGDVELSGTSWYFAGMDVEYKIWIEKDGKTVFGMGIYHLLVLVRETGSLHKAAEILKMSYRAAWGKVRDYEERLGIGLLEKGRHGRTGAHLTPEGEVMVKRFQGILKEMDTVMTTRPITKLMGEIEHIKAHH